MVRLRLLLLMVVASLLVGCQHIPLYDPSTGLYLHFNFDFVYADEEATKGMVEEFAGGMRVYLYDKDSHELVMDVVLPRDGGFVDIAPGYYDCIAFSMGSEVIQYSGLRSRGEAFAYCEKIGSSLSFTKQSDENEDEAATNINFPIINEPDGLLVANASDIYVPEHNGAQQTVQVEMKVLPVVKGWTFEAVNVQGAENIRAMKCYVTGQIPGRYLWEGRFGMELAAIGFGVEYDSREGVIRGGFNTFGKHPQALANVFLNITVQSAGGGFYQWIYDVTSQFDDPDNTERRLVVSSPIAVPNSDGGGYSPQVSDWNAEINHVPLN